MFPCRWVCKRMTVSMYRYYLLWKLKILAIHLCHFENSDKWKSETWWCVHILADRILFRSLLLKGAQSVLLEQSWVLHKKLLCFSSWLIIVNVLIWHSKLWTSHLWEGKEKKKGLSKLFLWQFNLNILIRINMLLEIPQHEFFSELIKWISTPQTKTAP